LLQNLTHQANTILAAVLQAPLQPLNCVCHGEFPYDAQHSANLVFNHLTYNWINSSLVAAASRFRTLTSSSFPVAAVPATSRIRSQPDPISSRWN
jgi:hypothetical protein